MQTLYLTAGKYLQHLIKRDIILSETVIVRHRFDECDYLHRNHTVISHRYNWTNFQITRSVLRINVLLKPDMLLSVIIHDNYLILLTIFKESVVECIC